MEEGYAVRACSSPNYGMQRTPTTRIAIGRRDRGAADARALCVKAAMHELFSAAAIRTRVAALAVDASVKRCAGAVELHLAQWLNRAMRRSAFVASPIFTSCSNPFRLLHRKSEVAERSNL